MLKYAVLFNPGHSRVYFDEARRFSVNEMMLALPKLSVEISEVTCENIAGVYYLTFYANTALICTDVKILGALSFFYALYEVCDGLLKPIEIPEFRYMDEGLGSMLKYTGKTNELFTRLLINIAAWQSETKGALKILDPLAGKGTTLFEGASLGHDVYGIEINEKLVDEVYTFFKKYLEMKKYKHESSIEKIGGPNKSFRALKYSFSYSKNKEDFKNKLTKKLQIVAGDSSNVNALYKKNTFDAIVGDLPYGVQHGSSSGSDRKSFTRNPESLLETCLPAWYSVLKNNGIIVLSWNTFVINRKNIGALLEKHNFKVFEGEIYDGFLHRVDQAINRDVISAKKI